MAIVKVTGLSTGAIVYVAAKVNDIIVLNGKDVPVKKDGYLVDTRFNDVETAFHSPMESSKYVTEDGAFYVTVDGQADKYIELEDYLAISFDSPIDRVVKRDLEGLGNGGGGNVDLSNYYNKAQVDIKFDNVNTKAESNNLYAIKSNTYTKGEVDAKVNTKADASSTYSKQEVNDNFLLKDGTYSKDQVDAKLDEKADSSDVYTKADSDLRYLRASNIYTKPEIDSKVSELRRKDDSYSKGETDQVFAKKSDVPNLGDSYTKTQIDVKLADKSDKGYSYSKIESDENYKLKADKTDTYTKNEVDNNFVNKSEMHPPIDAYTKAQSDTRYPQKSDIYTRVEIDGKFITRREVYVHTDKVLSDNGSTSANKAALDAKLEVGKYLMEYDFNGVKFENGDYAYIEIAESRSDHRQTYSYVKEGHGSVKSSLTLAYRSHNGIEWCNWVTFTDISQDNIYTKEQIDSFVNGKANKSDVFSKGETYSRQQADLKFALKDASGGVRPEDIYTIEETNDLLDKKANVGVSYTKAESDGQLSQKADTNQVYSKTQAGTIFAVKEDVNSKVESDMKYPKKEDVYTKAGADQVFAKIEDIPSLSDGYSKEQADAKFNLKADKSTTYSKVDVDNKLTPKADASEVYIKSEVESMVNAKEDRGTSYSKADSDLKYETKGLSYSKAQIDAKVNAKEDKGTSYSKGEADGLFAKTDDFYSKTYVDTQLGNKANSVDVYTKTQIDNQDKKFALKDDVPTKLEMNTELLKKENAGVSYTKAQSDFRYVVEAELSQKVNAYTRAESDNMLYAKADKSNTYTMSESENRYASKSNVYNKLETITLLDKKADISDVYTVSESNTVFYTKGLADGRFARKSDVYLIDETYNKREIDSKLSSIGKDTITTTYPTMGRYVRDLPRQPHSDTGRSFIRVSGNMVTLNISAESIQDNVGGQEIFSIPRELVPNPGYEFFFAGSTTTNSSLGAAVFRISSNGVVSTNEYHARGKKFQGSVTYIIPN